MDIVNISLDNIIERVRSAIEKIKTTLRLTANYNYYVLCISMLIIRRRRSKLVHNMEN